MKPFFALMRAAGISAAGLLLSGASAEAAFFPRSGMTTQRLVLQVQYGPYGPYRQHNSYRQYNPLQQYSPGMRQNSIAARAAFCRCYSYDAFRKRRVCRYPGRGTTVQIVDSCY
jgi:hypothetical protein